MQQSRSTAKNKQTAPLTKDVASKNKNLKGELKSLQSLLRFRTFHNPREQFHTTRRKVTQQLSRKARNKVAPITQTRRI